MVNHDHSFVVSARRRAGAALLLTVLFAAPGCGEPEGDPEAATARAWTPPASTRLLGMHGPWDGLAEQNSLFNGSRGWLVDVIYSTDEGWSADPRWNNAANAGYAVALRIDYARGTNVPPPGGSGCITGYDGQPGVGSNHLDCFLNAIDTIVDNNGSVHAWIIGNEPNLNIEAELFPGQQMSASHFASMYTQARDRIRARPGHGDDLVFLGGVSPGGVAPGRYADGNTFLGSSLAALDPAEVDGIAIHAYGGWPDVADNGGQTAISVFQTAWQSQMQVIDSHGFDCAAVLISEFNAAYHSNEVIANPNSVDATAGSQFLADAVAGVHNWNTSGNHPIAGMAWFTWTGGEWSQYVMDFWWDRAGLAGQSSSNNWALRFQGLAPTYAAAFPDASCDGGGDDTGANDTGGGGDCPCLPGYDNICNYLPQYPECQALMGISQCVTNEDWSEGWYYYNLPSKPGYVCGGGGNGGGLCPSGDGNFCGGEGGVDGDPSFVYACDGGTPRVEEVCANGCSNGTCLAGNNPTPDCACPSGKYHTGQDIPTSFTYCGFRVCGMDGNVWECQTNDQWTTTGLTCGNGDCTCANGSHKDQTDIPASLTECGMAVCGQSGTWYTCEANDAWAEVPGSSCTMDEAVGGPNSCVGHCGGFAGACWCDSYCANYGDCCADKVAVCG